MITIKTSHGDISVELFEEQAPISCENFRQYATDGFYAGTVFHRVIPNFMIQGGGMPEDMSRKPTREPIKNEAANGEKNLRGTLAMARTGQVDSATSQFFINLRDNDFLDHGTRDYGYAVFAKVVGGNGCRRRDRRCPHGQSWRPPGRPAGSGYDPGSSGRRLKARG